MKFLDKIPFINRLFGNQPGSDWHDPVTTLELLSKEELRGMQQETIQDLQDEGVLNPKALFYIRGYIDAKFDGNDFNSDGYFINKANKIDQFYAEGKAEVYAACTGYGELMERTKEADLRLRRAIVALDPKTVISTEDCKLVDDSEKFMNDYNQLTDKLNWEAK